jgi:hypothetical protein
MLPLHFCLCDLQMAVSKYPLIGGDPDLVGLGNFPPRLPIISAVGIFIHRFWVCACFFFSFYLHLSIATSLHLTAFVHLPRPFLELHRGFI